LEGDNQFLPFLLATGYEPIDRILASVQENLKFLSSPIGLQITKFQSICFDRRSTIS